MNIIDGVWENGAVFVNIGSNYFLKTKLLSSDFNEIFEMYLNEGKLN